MVLLYQLSTGARCATTQDHSWDPAMLLGTGTVVSTSHPLVEAVNGTAITTTTTTTAVSSSMFDPSTTTTTLDPSDEAPSTVSLKRPMLLTTLVGNARTSCGKRKFEPVQDVVRDAATAYANHRRIPRIIHTTSKSRCMPAPLRNNLQHWQNMTDYSFFMHDDDAVDLLIHQDWPEFPQLSKAVQCLRSGAAKADLWRALVLWEYGGVYTDMDNAPVKFSATSIQTTDDAFFVVEGMGILSQFFMAASPRHPLLYLLVQVTMHRLYDLPDIANQYVPFVTGPGALKTAFQQFMRAQPPRAPPGSRQRPPPPAAGSAASHQRVSAGLYEGIGNRTVTVVGHKRRDTEYVQRNAIGSKKQLYQQMGMTHFSKIPRQQTNESCFHRLYATEQGLPAVGEVFHAPLW